MCLQKTDSLSKLYEMDDSPERRAWLDKLLAFMEERRTPITTCPTISKNPLDLYRLYVFVKERGGFMEVCKSKVHLTPVILSTFPLFINVLKILAGFATSGVCLFR